MSVSASVIIPVHNAASFVVDAINSCLVQTRDDIEVIVVDDGSSDGSWDVIRACAQRDSRVKPQRRAASGGPGAARNTGMQQAKGSWLAVLDADDLFLPNRLNRIIKYAESVGADMVADNLLKRDFASGRDLGTLLPAAAMVSWKPLSVEDLVRGDMPDLPSDAKLGFLQPVFRRNFLAAQGIRYAEDIRVGESFSVPVRMRGARRHASPHS